LERGPPVGLRPPFRPRSKNFLILIVGDSHLDCRAALAAKTLLATRPIFHRTDAAIRGHVFCTFLALVLRKELMDRLTTRRITLPEWQHIVDDLDDLSEIEVEQDGRRALLRTAPGPTIDPLCRAVGVTLPPVFQELPRTGATI
jgi:hypothetical protein